MKKYLEYIKENKKIPILNIIQSKAAYDILDHSKVGESSFQFGGCWILADALSEYYNVPVYVVFNTKLNRIDHFVVKINDMFLDSDGIQSEIEMIKKVANDGFYDPKDLKIIPFNENLNTGDIIQDKIASSELVKLFNKI